jgi:hypothetical protein
MSTENLGQPLTETFAVAGGQARLFERGATLTGAGGEAVVVFELPLVGRPSIVTGDPAAVPVFETHAIRFAQGAWQLAELAALVQAALAGRLGLVPTGQAGPALPFSFGPAAVVTGDVHGLPATAAALQERQLYDVAVLADGDQWRVVAPHAVYHRRSWTDFGIAHVTDLHVARRIDGFRELLVQAGRHQAAARLINFNDRFRGFVRYANHLHAIGVLDVVLSTGDQYDYIFEDDDDPAGGGNAAFMRRLVLGQAPGPDFPDVEELQVPIFMIPGNHDYRKHAYKLLFDVHVGNSVIGVDVKRFRNFSGYNLRGDDARVLALRLDGVQVDALPFGLRPVPEASIDGAIRMVIADPEIAAYKQHLADRTSYVVRLGSHRIVMLDSGPDVGVLSSPGDLLNFLIGNTSEDEDTFVAGSPNTEGVEPGELEMVAGALSEPADGLVVVGIHTPLVNPVDEEYPYFLRETQRASQADQVHAFLARHGAGVVGHPSKAAEQMKARHPTWYPDAHDDRPPAFVKRQDRQDKLDFAVSRGEADGLIRLLAGVGSPRRADLVLSGHTHYHNEFTVRPMPAGELAFYMDFYTQNPANYYPTRFARGWGGGGILPFRPETDKTHVGVLPGAAPDGAPAPIEDAPLKHDLKVPPYPDPLGGAADAAAWWSERRPLLLQTGALGPIKTELPFLTGFRVLSVRNNVVERIHFVSTGRLEAHNYRLPWEEATLPEPPGPPTAPWGSVSEGSSAPGGHVTAVATGGNRIALFLADPLGGMFATEGSHHGGWAAWSDVAGGGSTPGAPVSAVVMGDRITVVVAGPDGTVFANEGKPGGWGLWGTVSDGSTTPGGHVSAVRVGDRIVVALADKGGGIFATEGTRAGGWGPWRHVSHGSSTPGAALGAVAIGDRVTLVLADPGGGIFANEGRPDRGWGPWRSVSEGSTIPGGHVTAIPRGGDQVTLVLADPGGGIFAVTGSHAGGWGPWRNVSEGLSLPGAPVAGVVAGGRTTFVLADPNGGVFARASARPSP